MGMHNGVHGIATALRSSPLRRVATGVGGATAATGGLYALHRMQEPAREPTLDARDPAAFERLFSSAGPGWKAGDGTISVPLDDGRSIWLFGDSIVEQPNGSRTMVRNAAVRTDGSRTTLLGEPGTLLAPSQPDTWYWPAGGVQQGDELALFMGKVQHARDVAPGPAEWNFRGAGSDLVIVDAQTMRPRAVHELPGGAAMTWGAATLRSGGYTYVYGFEQGDDPLERFVHVARIRDGRLGREPMEHWDGAGWSHDVTRSARVADGVSNQFSVVELPSGRFALLSQELMLSAALTSRTAPTPIGPWGSPRIVDPGPSLSPGTFSYNAMAHPQFTADGKLLVSWNRNRASIPGQLLPDAAEYRATFRSVPLGSLEST